MCFSWLTYSFFIFVYLMFEPTYKSREFFFRLKISGFSQPMFPSGSSRLEWNKVCACPATVSFASFGLLSSFLTRLLPFTRSLCSLTQYSNESHSHLSVAGSHALPCVESPQPERQSVSPLDISDLWERFFYMVHLIWRLRGAK